VSAVASPPTDTIVSQPANVKTYASRRGSLTLVHTPEYPIYGPGGREVGKEAGARIMFTDGVLRVPLNGKITTQQGREIDAAPIIEWLDKHRLNGDQYEGFFEVPQAAPPVTDDELEGIMEAGYTHDMDRLEAIAQAERAGWNRAQIVGAVEKALGRIREMHAQIEAQRAAEDAEAKRPKK
jgi:hypothetical protein